MKGTLLSAMILLGIYAILSLLLREREAIQKSLSFFFSVSLLFLIFTPLLSSDLFRPLEEWKNDISENTAVGEGDDYFSASTEAAVTEAFCTHLAERFSLSAEELSLSCRYGDGLRPRQAVLTLTGAAALSDLVAIEAYGQKHFCESFEVQIHVG